MIYWSRYNCWVVTIQWFNNQQTTKIGKQDFMWCRPWPTSVRLYSLTLILGPNDNQNTNQDKDAADIQDQHQDFEKRETKTKVSREPQMRAEHTLWWQWSGKMLRNKFSQPRQEFHLPAVNNANQWLNLTLSYLMFGLAGDQGCLLYRLQWKQQQRYANSAITFCSNQQFLSASTRLICNRCLTTEGHQFYCSQLFVKKHKSTPVGCSK